MASPQAQVPEIPGFYYDHEKRRYFRCPPTHFAHLPQYQGLQPTTRDESSDDAVVDKPHPSTTPTRPTLPLQQNNSVFGFVQAHQYHPDSGIQSWYERLLVSVERKQVFNPKQIPCRGMLMDHDCNYTYHDIAISESGELLAVVYSDNQPQDRFITILHVKGTREIATSRPTHVLMARFLDLDLMLGFYHQEKKEIIPAFTRNSILCFELLREHPPVSDEFFEEGREWTIDFGCSFDYNEARTSVSAVALGPSDQTGYQMAVGSADGYIYLRHPGNQAGHSFLRRGGRSSVLSLAFSSQNPILFSGCRNGCITAWDLRAGSRSSILHVTEQRHGRVHSSVIGLHPLKDDSYLISSAYNSHLSIWDLRMGRVVWRFTDHVNTIRNCKSLLDDSESLLFAAGSDRNIRLWSTRTGALLRTITVEEYVAPGASEEGIPALCYTPTLGGTGGPALLISMGENVTVFEP